MANVDQSAALRRERRRQKILTASEDRMKKITGYGNKQQDLTEPTATSKDLGDPLWDDHSHEVPSKSEDLVRPNCTRPLVLDGVVRRMSNMSTDSHSQPRDSPAATSESDAMGDDQRLFDSVNRHNPIHQSPAKPHEEALIKPTVNGAPLGQGNDLDTFADSFMKIRTVLMLVVGILVRLSFEYSFGQEYVQSIVNPFTALEIAIIGYQKGIGMDLGANVKGGIWLSTLVLAGIKTEIIYTYKSVMGVITAATSDFAVFFFGFIALHLVL